MITICGPGTQPNHLEIVQRDVDVRRRMAHTNHRRGGPRYWAEGLGLTEVGKE